MPVTYQIFPERGLVYVRYEGFAKLDESFEVFGAYMQDPLFRPGQKQLVDLSRVTGLERDYPRMFALQAKKVEAFMQSNVQTLMVYYAPDDVNYELARTILRSWEPSGMVVATAQRSEAETLNILGQPESRFEDLLQAAA